MEQSVAYNGQNVKNAPGKRPRYATPPMTNNKTCLTLIIIGSTILKMSCIVLSMPFRPKPYVNKFTCLFEKVSNAYVQSVVEVNGITSLFS